MAIPAPNFSGHKLTVADYHRLGAEGALRPENRTELINGEISEMAPIGSAHAGIVAKLIRLMTRAVGEKAIINAQNPILLKPDSEPEPDLVLLRPRDDYYTKSHPEPVNVILVVEVADTTLRKDRDIKIPLYAKHGIPEVWLVDLENNLLHVFRAPTADGYREIESLDKPGTIAPRLLPECGVDLSGLF